MASIHNVPVDPTKFSPLTIHFAILEPLRYLFSKVPPEHLRYCEDVKETKIVIDSVNNHHSDNETQGKPRILLNRGSFSVSKTGLTDNLAEATPIGETKGLKDAVNMVFVNGQSILTIEATEEGTVELLADMVRTFIVWSRPHICNTFRFKEFGLPLHVSEPQQLSEDVEKFKVDVSVPWSVEDLWTLKDDAIQLKSYFTNIVR